MGSFTLSSGWVVTFNGYKALFTRESDGASHSKQVNAAWFRETAIPPGCDDDERNLLNVLCSLGKVKNTPKPIIRAIKEIVTAEPVRFGIVSATLCAAGHATVEDAGVVVRASLWNAGRDVEEIVLIESLDGLVYGFKRSTRVSGAVYVSTPVDISGPSDGEVRDLEARMMCRDMDFSHASDVFMTVAAGAAAGVGEDVLMAIHHYFIAPVLEVPNLGARSDYEARVGLLRDAAERFFPGHGDVIDAMSDRALFAHRVSN